MSPVDDDQDMRALEDELLLTGEPAPSEPELAAFVQALRFAAEEPAPRPTPALRTVLRDGLAPASAPRAVPAVAVGNDRPRLRSPLRYVAGLGLAAKILLGAGVAAASVTGAATIDAVPDAVQRPASAVLSGVVDLFTPRAAAPVERAPAHPAPQHPAPQPGGVDAPAPGTGSAGTTTDGGAPETSPSAAPAVPGLAVRPSEEGTSGLGVQVPGDLGVGSAGAPEVHGLPTLPGLPDAARAGTLITPSPVVPPVLSEKRSGLAP